MGLIFSYWTSLKNGTKYLNGTITVDQNIWDMTEAKDRNLVVPWSEMDHSSLRICMQIYEKGKSGSGSFNSKRHRFRFFNKKMTDLIYYPQI